MDCVKRAGDVQGIPEWQRELWAGEMEVPDHPIHEVSYAKRLKASVEIRTGVKLEDLSGFIMAAQEIVDGTPQGDKLLSLYDQYSDLIYELRKVADEIWRIPV